MTPRCKTCGAPVSLVPDGDPHFDRQGAVTAAVAEAGASVRAEYEAALLCDRHKHMSLKGGCRYCLQETVEARLREPLPCSHLVANLKREKESELGQMLPDGAPLKCSVCAEVAQAVNKGRNEEAAKWEGILDAAEAVAATQARREALDGALEKAISKFCNNYHAALRDGLDNNAAVECGVDAIRELMEKGATSRGERHEPE